MNTTVEHGDILKRFRKSELGSKLYSTVQKQGLMTAMAPASALASIVLKAELQDSNKLSVLWVGDTSALKPDGARWMGLTSLLLENEDLALEFNIVEESQLGMETPWSKTAASLPDLDIIKLSPGNALSSLQEYDLVILSQPDFIQSTDSDLSIIANAINLKTPVYGLFWSEFDKLCESVPAQIYNLQLGDSFLNPVQLESSKSGGDRIASVLAEINLSNTQNTLNNDDIEFFSWMRALSGFEGHSNQFNMPGDKVKNMKLPFVQYDSDFIHVIDNYILDTRTKYLFRQSLSENSICAICQVHSNSLDIPDANASVLEKLTWGFKVKALNVFDNRLLNLNEASYILNRLIDSYTKDTGALASRVLGAQILAHKGKPLNLNGLVSLYERGAPEAMMLFIRAGTSIDAIDKESELKLLKYSEELSNNSVADATVYLAKTFGDKFDLDSLAKKSAYQFHKNTMYIEAINLIEAGLVEDGLDMMLLSAILGDEDSRQDLPCIIEDLKKTNVRDLIPRHHLKNKNKYKNMR